MPSFMKEYKKIGHERRKRTKDAIGTTTASSDPADLGDYKKDIGVFSYEIGRKDRIIFTVDYGVHKVVFLRLCDHKSAYGKD